MINPRYVSLPVHNLWISQQRAQLSRHLEQCWSGRRAMTATQCLDAVHTVLGTRFLTTVCGVAALLLLPLAWWG